MTNKIMKMGVVLIIAMIGALTIVRMFLSSTNSLTYRIFDAETEGYYFHKLLGIIPSSYQDRYSKAVLDSFNDKKILNLVDDMESSHKNFIVFANGTNSRFLKAYPFELVGVKKEIVQRSGWSKHVSLLINIEVFNDYVRAKGIKSKDEIIKTYCYFLSNPADGLSFKVLRDEFDIDTLINKRPLTNLEFFKSTGQKLVDFKSIDFTQSNEAVFCWLYDTGIVKFNFTFNQDNTLKSVDSEILGFLGNETPAI
jgi:hypothetical protein